MKYNSLCDCNWLPTLLYWEFIEGQWLECTWVQHFTLKSLDNINVVLFDASLNMDAICSTW